MQGSAGGGIDPIDGMRAEVYRLLAQLLLRPPAPEMLGLIATLQPSTGTPFSDAAAGLVAAARSTTPEAAEREYNRLFIGLERGEVVPFASYYVDGHLFGAPLIRFREDLAALGFERVETVPEPEDHAGFMLDVMAELVDGARTGEPRGHDVQQAIFLRHLDGWIVRLMRDVEKAEAADFYRSVGALGALFLDTESKIMTMPEELPS